MEYIEEWRIEKDLKLLPCPFCGGEAVFIDDRENPSFNMERHIECTKCGARVRVFQYEEWNHRVNSSKEAKALKYHIEKVQAQNKKIIERLELEKLYREHIAYSLYRKDEHYLQCKTWEECLKLAQKEFENHYGEKKI